MSPEDRRKSIVAAALPLLRAKGVQISTADIAREAGVAEGTLFRVFTNKDEIIQAAIEDAMDPAHTIAELQLIDSAGSLPDRVTEIIQILHARIADVSLLMGILQASGLRHKHPYRQHIRTQHEEHGATLRVAIAQVLEPDADRLRESPEVTASLLRAIAFATAHPLLSDRLVTDAQEVADLFLYGLLTRCEGDRPC